MENFPEAAWADAYRIAYSILHDPHAAQDAAQNACARAWAGIGRLRSPEHFKVWFYRIVANECKRFKQAQSRYAAAAELHPSALAEPIEDRIDVRQAIASLDSPLRIVVVLRYYFNLTSAEISHVLSISPVTVRWRSMLAHRRLRTRLEDCVPASASHSKLGAVYSHESIVEHR
jgi:RNA polymerase sigma factor (sigma-70 family)